MNPEQAAALRAPFADSQIGQLPRTTCRECSDSRSGVCDKPAHTKRRCDGSIPGLPKGCNNYMTSAHLHLDYVGHAAVTDRLLQVDPEWYWTPAATDPNTGAPLKSDGGLWITLTVCGMSRYGWGDGKNIKECIGDAIRNAAMRFGVALDLWAKEDLHAEPPANPADLEVVASLTASLNAMTGKDRADFKAAFGLPADLTTAQVSDALAWVTLRAERDGPTEPEPTAEAPAEAPHEPPAAPPALASTHADHIDWKAVGRELGLKQLDVLNAAREVATEAGLVPPGSLQKVPHDIDADLMVRLTAMADQATAAKAAT